MVVITSTKIQRKRVLKRAEQKFLIGSTCKKMKEFCILFSFFFALNAKVRKIKPEEVSASSDSTESQNFTTINS